MTDATPTWMQAITPVAAGLLRHVLTAGGGLLLARGWATSSTVEQLVSLGMIIGGAAWSWWQKEGHAQAAADIANLRAILAARAAAARSLQAQGQITPQQAAAVGATSAPAPSIVKAS
jgi:hypothetical protein